MEWDEATNCPISIEEMVNEAMTETCPAWATFEIENVGMVDNDKTQQGTEVGQRLDCNAIDMDDNSNLTFGLGNQTIGLANYAPGFPPRLMM